MALSMYQASIPTFIHALGNLIAILEKGLAHAEAKKIDPSVFLNSRLFPDMLPLTRQIHIATDGVKGCAARLAGQTPPVFEDNETTFPEVIARIQQTLGKDVNIIILLREPRQRAFSHYIHDFAHQREVTDLVYKRYLATTHYARALRNYFNAFGQRNCLIQIFEEDFLPSQQRLVDNVCAFLGIASHSIAPVHSNPSCLPSAIWSPMPRLCVFFI